MYKRRGYGRLRRKCKQAGQPGRRMVSACGDGYARNRSAPTVDCGLSRAMGGIVAAGEHTHGPDAVTVGPVGARKKSSGEQLQVAKHVEHTTFRTCCACAAPEPNFDDCFQVGIGELLGPIVSRLNLGGRGILYRKIAPDTLHLELVIHHVCCHQTTIDNVAAQELL